ncbi:MAG: ACP phosphodiesterase [Pseudomonadota bacterium]
MNFLAHCLIPDRAVADAHPDLLAGGFLGDFLKGPVPDHLPPVLATGIRLHRRIDAYSNEHPAIRRSCDAFPARLRRFAPIFVDVIADHLLARHWHRFHPAPLPEFSRGAYAAIGRHVPRLPESGRRFFTLMTERDLLTRYREPQTLHRSLASVARRLRRPGLEDGLEEIVAARLPRLEADFLVYFPDLVHHAAHWLAAREAGGAQR